MKKIIILTIAALLLSGCGNQYIETTANQHAQIVEYIAGLLLKYDRSYQTKLVAFDYTEENDEPETEEISEEIREETVPEDEVTISDNHAPEIIDNTLPRGLTELVGIDGLEFNYNGAMITNKYPIDFIPGEVHFIIEAAMDYNLLVMKFDVVNRSGSDIFLDMNELGWWVRIGYNGENMSGAMFTLLPNDLILFQGLIAAGETVELMSLREVLLTDISEIETLEYFVRTTDGDFVFTY